MKKVKQLPIRVSLGLLEDELRALLENEHYQISAVREDKDGDYVQIEVFKSKKK